MKRAASSKARAEGSSSKEARVGDVTASSLEEDMNQEVLEVSNFIRVEELGKLGVNRVDIEKLQEAGLVTVGMCLKVPSKTLAAIRGFSDAKVRDILDQCRKINPSGGGYFKSGLQHQDDQKMVVKISTGCKDLDAILGGGVETGSLTEFFGEFRTGKTQLMHTLCVTSQLDNVDGVPGGKVIYLDLEGNFRSSRIESISARFGVDPRDILENIQYARAHTHEEQIELFKMGSIECSAGRVRLIIIDSIMARFRVEFCGRGELSERQQILGRHLADLCRMAEEFNVAVVYVNQVQSDPGNFLSTQPKPIGGHILAHASTTRVYLRKASGDERVAKIYDSPSVKEAECRFKISDGGIIDA